MENLVEEPAIAYNQKYTPDEYLHMEWKNGQRYEYWDGELVAMVGTNKVHSLMVHNINTFFRSKLKSKNCMSFQESIHLKIPEKDIYLLPDVMVTCNEKDLDLQDKTVENPTLIVEVLSKSNENYDRNTKWEKYRQIKSLRYFLLVSQGQYQVEMFSRHSYTGIFSCQTFNELEDELFFAAWNISLTLSDIYEDIKL